MYDYIVFDLYGTLVDIRTDESKKIVWKQMALFYRYSGITYNWEELKNAFYELVEKEEKHQKYTNRSKYSHETYPEIKIEKVFKQLYAAKGVEADDELVNKTCVHFRRITIRKLKLYKGTKEMLTSLKEAGKKIYLLSNAQRVFTEFEMNSLGILDMFDGVLISSDEGVKKPDKEFFLLLKERFDVNLTKAIMVGNDVNCDINGAKKVGMDALYIHSSISPADDPVPNCKYVLKKPEMKKLTGLLIK